MFKKSYSKKILPPKRVSPRRSPNHYTPLTHLQISLDPHPFCYRFWVDFSATLFYILYMKNEQVFNPKTKC